MSTPRILITLILAAACAFGGQSLSNTSVSVKNDSFPAISKSTPVRVEFYIHDWPSSPSSQSGTVILSHAVGISARYTGNNVLYIDSLWAAAGATFQIGLGGLPASGLYVR